MRIISNQTMSARMFFIEWSGILLERRHGASSISMALKSCWRRYVVRLTAKLSLFPINSYSSGTPHHDPLNCTQRHRIPWRLLYKCQWGNDCHHMRWRGFHKGGQVPGLHNLKRLNPSNVCLRFVISEITWGLRLPCPPRTYRVLSLCTKYRGIHCKFSRV